MSDRGTYLPLTWNRDTGELGVHLPEEEQHQAPVAEHPVLEHPTYLVEALVTYRMRYVVSCKSAEHAMDTVVMEQAKEFSQECLGEQIISAREIMHDEIIKLCDEDNDYCSTWDVDTKYRNFVSIVDYEKS